MLSVSLFDAILLFGLGMLFTMLFVRVDKDE